MVMTRHPLSGTQYYRNDDGTVRVVKAATGVFGTFDRFGTWLGGERRTADPALCMWVADGNAATTAQPDPSPAQPDPVIPETQGGIHLDERSSQ